MKYFYIVAHPNYFKTAMGWDMKEKEVRWTEDKLVMFAASENVPETILEPCFCGWTDTEAPIYNPSTGNYLR